MKRSVNYRALFAGISISLVITGVALAYGNFGSPGQSGYDGQSGQDGRSGQNIEVQALGQAESFNLQGSDGSNGSDGSPGSDAYSCYSGTPNYDLYGADGGNGGDGGRAGSGGSGGSVRIYYKDLTNIKSIFVDSTPGQSGYAGRGSQGGYGCRCSYYSWTNTVCREESRQVTYCSPVGCSPSTEGCTCNTRTEYYEVCNNYSYSCRDGDNGRSGTSGGGEYDGSYGNIELVQRLEPLEATTPSMGVPVETIATNKFELTRHEWDSLSGAQSLFANGSRMRSEYRKYAGKTIKYVQFDWMDTVRPVDYYRGSRVSLSLQGFPAQTIVEFPRNILVDGKQEVNGDTTKVHVTRSMKQEELTKIRVEDLVGKGQNLELVLVDDANVSDIAATKIFIKSDWDLEAGGEFDNWVPENLIRVEQNKIRINIGRLSGIKTKKLEKYFSDKCEFEMKVIRDFAGSSERVARDGGNTFDIEKDLKKNKPVEVKMENKSW